MRRRMNMSRASSNHAKTDEYVAYDVEFLPKTGGSPATPRSRRSRRSKKQMVIPSFVLCPIPAAPFASWNQTDQVYFDRTIPN